MTTQNIVNVGLSGITGTGTFVGSTSPTLITPTLGAATATSITFSPTTDGIVGTTTNDNAGSGYVGQFVSSVIASGSAISLTTGTAANVTSISLTAGDWNVFGNVSIAANTAVLSTAIGWISTTSETAPDSSLFSGIDAATSLIQSIFITAPFVRISVASTTTVYLSTFANFASGSVTACGGIYARRAR